MDQVQSGQRVMYRLMAGGGRVDVDDAPAPEC